MDDSILNSVKKYLGLEAEYTPFDEQIIMLINSVFMVFNQEGIGPTVPLMITDNTSTWDDFIQGATNMEAIRALTAMKVQVLFDPPSSSAVLEALNKTISEYEWRLYSLKDYYGGTTT